MPPHPPPAGLALPLVLVLGLGAHLALYGLFEAARAELRATPALAQATRALTDAETALDAARSRLEAALAFPASGCANGLCANRQAPAVDSYDWARGSAHQTVATLPGGAWWIESLGSVAAGLHSDCPGTSGGCEYVRVVASAAPNGVRRSLEACFRIRRAAGLAAVVTRLSWRQTQAP